MNSLSSVSSLVGQAGTAASQPKPPSLDAEKANCERQLADWVNCVSASTPQGKAKIEELSSKLSAIKASIKKAADAVKQGAATEATRRPTQTLGNSIDVFA